MQGFIKKYVQGGCISREYKFCIIRRYLRHDVLTSFAAYKLTNSTLKGGMKPCSMGT